MELRVTQKTDLACANKVQISREYLVDTLMELLEIPSPSGYTDIIVHHVGKELEKLGIAFELTRRGAMRAELTGREGGPRRAIVSHLDTNGAMVSQLKDNGRLSLRPIGTWSSRFAEGARVTIFTADGSHRGTILPLYASGHVYNDLIDKQPVTWDNVEIRVDEICDSRVELEELGMEIGNFVAIDPFPEVDQNGFINSRFLDNKAGVAVMLTAAKAIVDAEAELPVDCNLLFTIFEEVGSGASSILHGDVAEMVSIDNGTIAPEQNTLPFGVTICAMDSTGPFDYHLNQKLGKLCRQNNIPYGHDVFKYYRCDSASAIEAGNDIRTSLICYALDGSHGYERTHLDSLMALARLVCAYMQSSRTFDRDRQKLAPLEGFSKQPKKNQVLVKQAPEGFVTNSAHDTVDSQEETDDDE